MSLSELQVNDEVYVKQFGTRHGNTRIGRIKQVTKETIHVTLVDKVLHFKTADGHEVGYDNDKVGFRLICKYSDQNDD